MDSKSTEKDNFPGVSKMEKPDFVSMNHQKMEEFSNSIKTLYVLSNKTCKDFGPPVETPTSKISKGLFCKKILES